MPNLSTDRVMMEIEDSFNVRPDPDRLTLAGYSAGHIVEYINKYGNVYNAEIEVNGRKAYTRRTTNYMVYVYEIDGR